jgi:hypothetical protein
MQYLSMFCTLPLRLLKIHNKIEEENFIEKKYEPS